MSFTLRDYQAHAVEKILWSMKLDGNDLCCLPTGSGKSIVIAEVANQLKSDILITQPSVEILRQNVSKLKEYVDPWEVGIYSASAKRKTVSKYTFATIGSIYEKPELFDHIGLVLIDEAHLVNVRSAGSMYNSFLNAIGKPKCIGFTATPYRNVTGYHKVAGGLEAAVTLKLLTRMWSPKQPFVWNRLLVNINIGDLMRDGYLCPLEYELIETLRLEELKLNKSETDFDLDDYEVRLGSRERQIIERIAKATEEHKSILVFCTSVRQAEKFAECFPNAYSVSAKTDAKTRDAIIDGFKDGRIKLVFNMGVLTTGFDHPALDCIVLIRPTRSVLLYAQMIGRGVRNAEGKTSCRVIDFSGCVESIGRIETIRLHKGEEKGDKWELYTETGEWHNKPLYKYFIKQSKVNHRATDIAAAANSTAEQKKPERPEPLFDGWA